MVVGGYNQDRAEVIEADTHCRVHGDGARTAAAAPCWCTIASATAGTSGGPLLMAGDGELVLGGVQVAGHEAAAGGVAVPVETLRRLLWA